MKRLAAGGLSANRPLQAGPEPPQMQQQPSFSGLSANRPMTAPVFQPAPSSGLSANVPMQQASFGGLSANVPMMQQSAFGGLSSNRPMQQQSASFGLSANRPMTVPPPAAPSSGLSANIPMMQQAAFSGLSANNPMKQQSASRGLSPDVPLSISNIARESRISVDRPLSMMNSFVPTIQQNKPMSTKLNYVVHSLTPDRPLTQPGMDIDDNIDLDLMDIETPSSFLPTFTPLREQPPENFFIERENQLVYFQQSQYAKSGPDPEPIVKNVAEAEALYTSFLAGKYSSKQSILPTNQIEAEIKSLNELYESQFITHAQYEKRLSELEAAQKHSFVSIVPHIEAAFSEARKHASSSKNRNIRLFVSSTFTDMQADREIIMRKVVPKLQKLCKERGVVLSVVDLRWGITSEQSNQGQTINICLKEIDRCRPYFLCMLGNRYGWCQPLSESGKPKDQLLARTFENAFSNFSWTDKYADRSITELEVRHAVLNDSGSETARRAAFFLRGSTMDDDDKRLSALKDEIGLNTDLKTQAYTEASQLEDLITPLLESIIEKDFPLQGMPSPLERERMSHEAFQETRASVYIGRQYYFDTINSHLAIPNASPLVIIGGSGSGKSALVCNWVVRFKESHPATLLIAHYVGSTAASTELGRVLQRIFNELKEFFKIEREVPKELKDLIDQLPQWLSLASRNGGCVIVLDALNQMDPAGNSHDLSWLPKSFPPNVKLVVSTLPGQVRNVLTDRKWTTLEVQPLTKSERKTLVIEYLAMSGKTLTDNQLELIISSSQCENPLFLRVLLEEIQTFGVFEQLEKHIKSYLVARDPPELFALVFSRLEREFETNRPGLIGRMLSLLWVSRRGLTEEELIAILNISSAIWSPMYLAFSESIVSKSGYLAFFHDYMRQAVEKRYLQPTSNYNSAHILLMEHFGALPNDDPRKFEEAPYQMECAGAYPQLFQFITNMDHFNQLVKNEHKFDLYRYWRVVSQNMGNPAETLISNCRSTRTDALQNWSNLGTFLEEIGEYESAESCAREAVKIAETQGDKDVLCKKWTSLAYILRLKGRYPDAAPFYEKALAYLENKPNVDQRELASNINSLAILYRMMGKYDKAEPLYKRALSIRQGLFGSRHEDIAQSMNSLGCLNQDMGRYAEAEKYLLEAIAQREQLLGNGHPDVAMSLNNLGGLYLDWSKYGLAEPAYQRALKIYESVFGTRHPLVAKSYNSLAGLMNEQGKYKEAEVMYIKTLKLKEELLGEFHPELALTLNDFAVLYSRQDNFKKAEALYRRAMSIREKVLGTAHPDYGQSVKNMAACYQDQQRFNEALPLFRKALEITQGAFGPRHQDVASALSSLAGCLQMLSNFKEAEDNYTRALNLLIELNGENHGDVALALNDMAVLQWRMKNMDRAEEYYSRAIKAYQNVYGNIHPNTGAAVLNMAQFLVGTGKHDKALKFFNQALEIFTSTSGADHPKTQQIQADIARLS